MPANKNVATLEEIAVFWTEILRDSESELKDRLKVSELLSRFSSDLSLNDDIDDFRGMSLDECYEYIGKILECGEKK